MQLIKILSDKVHPTVQIGFFSVVYDGVEIGEGSIIGEGCVIGRSPTPIPTMKKKLDTGDKKVVLGRGVRLGSHVTVYQNVEIGDEVLLGDNVSVFCDVEIGSGTLISRNVTINSEVVIGKNSRIMDNTHITGRSKIGHNVFISAGVTMANDKYFGKLGYGSHIVGPTIGDGSCVGAGAILLPGVHIGQGCIIAAGSIVTSDFPDGVVLAGNPAKIIAKT